MMKLASPDSAAQAMILSAAFQLEEGALIPAEALPELSLSGKPEQKHSWNARARLFGEQADAIAGVLVIDANAYHLTGSLVSTSANPIQVD